jgi:PleD family two-component response regulator
MEETCIVMHSAREGRFDYERGRKAGVDEYLSKRPPDIAWYAQIDAAFNTAALRRSVKAARASLAVMPTPSRRGLQ